jgi:L-2-hydroxyglutarate oxidase LhgO
MSSVDFDCAVVGAGVVGIAVARACAARGMSVVILEQHARFGEETSSRNSEVIHSGIYYPTGSLKARLCVAGRDLLYRYCEARGIAHRRCGKLIVATAAAEEQQLRALQARAAANSIGTVDWLGADDVARLEPQVRCIAALHIPITGIVSSHDFMLSMIGDLERDGGWISFNTLVERIEPDTLAFAVFAAGVSEPVRTRILINAAGLHASNVARRVAGIEAPRVPNTRFARGHYFNYAGAPPFRHLVYPIPVEAGLGIHATLDLAGRVRFGPDVQWIDSISYEVAPERGAAFYAAIRRYWPGLQDGKLEPSYAGIRPKLVTEGQSAADFVIQAHADHGVPRLINLLGIESPGLTSSLAIGERVAALAHEQLDSR